MSGAASRRPKGQEPVLTGREASCAGGPGPSAEAAETLQSDHSPRYAVGLALLGGSPPSSFPRGLDVLWSLVRAACRPRSRSTKQAVFVSPVVSGQRDLHRVP